MAKKIKPKVGFVYYLKYATAPKVFDGFQFECLLTDQKRHSESEIIEDTKTHIKDWKHKIYKPERFNTFLTPNL